MVWPSRRCRPAATTAALPRYLPGGIGAVAFDQVLQAAWPGTHGGVLQRSLLNPAQGRFGPPVSAVRWIATLGNDCMAWWRCRDAPTNASLAPHCRRFGPRDWRRRLGSRDWVKTALLVRAAGRTTTRVLCRLKAVANAQGAGQPPTSSPATQPGPPTRCRKSAGAHSAVLAPRGCPAPGPLCPRPASKALTCNGPPCAASTWPPACPPRRPGVDRRITGAQAAALRAMPPCAPAMGCTPLLTERRRAGRLCAAQACSDYRRLAQDLGLRSWPR